MDVDPGSSAAPGAVPRPLQRVSSVQLHVHEEKQTYVGIDRIIVVAGGHAGESVGSPGSYTHTRTALAYRLELHCNGVFTKNSPFVSCLMRESGSIQIQAEDFGWIADETRKP